jgi:hypothetical protein
MYLRHVVIRQLAQLIMEVGLLLLELVEALLTFFKLVSHFDFNCARLIDLGCLLVKFFLDYLKLFFPGLECLQFLLEVVVETQFDNVLRLVLLQLAV